MLGTQAVETIDMLFSAYFPLPCFLCLHLQRQHYICQQDMIYINIKLFYRVSVRESLETSKILAFQGCIYTMFISILHVLFLCVLNLHLYGFLYL